MSKITTDELEKIILETEPPTLSDKGDEIWTRRMAFGMANLFNTRIAALETENADLRSGSYLASVVEERDRYRAALIEASTRMKNARGACESNQVADKDVQGTLTRGMFEIAEALGE